jgi:hypothetical protein
MIYFASCFIIGLFATLFIMRSSMRYERLSADHDLSGPQKFTLGRCRALVVQA